MANAVAAPAPAPAAGQTIIEEHYTRFASQRKAIKLTNNLAAAAALVFISMTMHVNNIGSGGKELEPFQLLLSFAEPLTWLCLVLGFGVGRAAREKMWLLRVGMLMSSGVLCVHVLNMAPDRLSEIGEILADDTASGHNYQVAGIMSQFAAMGLRMGCLTACTSYLKEQRTHAAETAAKRAAATVGKKESKKSK